MQMHSPISGLSSPCLGGLWEHFQHSSLQKAFCTYSWKQERNRPKDLGVLAVLCLLSLAFLTLPFRWFSCFPFHFTFRKSLGNAAFVLLLHAIPRAGNENYFLSQLLAECLSQPGCVLGWFINCRTWVSFLLLHLPPQPLPLLLPFSFPPPFKTRWASRVRVSATGALVQAKAQWNHSDENLKPFIPVRRRQK